MQKTKAIIFIIIGIWSSFSSLAQSDSTIFSYQEYLENIVRFHPIAKKANLQPERAAAALLAAKGNLDPTIITNWNQKNFDKKLYYRQYQGKLKIPTILGIDLVGGYENTEGVFLNPENNTDDFGLWHVGVEANVLQGLIINERRTALQQAKVFQELSANERQIALNELLYEASLIYLDWQKYHYAQTIFEENIELANTYFDNTKSAFKSGEKTAMDTLEAFIIYRDAIVLSQKNQVVLAKVRQNVENYLWFEDNPVFLQLATQPDLFRRETFQPAINTNTTNLLNQHPAILASINKLSYYEIEQKLKREKLKPKLKVKFNPLLATSDDGITPNYSTSDYKWGFDFSMPLLFRKERAGVQKGTIKIQEVEFDLDNKRNELLNKIEGSIQQQVILIDQINLIAQNIEGYRLLLNGEREKFNFGESSVFLVNKRQEKYINGQLKLIEVSAKFRKEWFSYLFYTNRLIDQ